MKKHSMLTSSCALLCLAMSLSVAADDKKDAKTNRQDAPEATQRMNKGEIISEVATAPVPEKAEKSERSSKPAKPQKPAKPTKPTKPVKTELQAKPAEPQQANDNSNTKSGSINSISSGCTLEEKLKGNKICKKD